MKKYIFLSAVLSICVLLCSCAGAPDEGQTTVLFDAATTATSETTQITTEGPTICPEDPNNRRAREALVKVLLDGERIEPWSSLLYSRYDGIVADGYIMFMDPPYNEIPEYDLTKDIKITIDGAEKTTVTIRDAVTHSIIGKCDTANLADNIKNIFGAGKYIVVFDAKNHGTGDYANDCVVYSYYFYVNVR